jgi:hypothetical protein
MDKLSNFQNILNLPKMHNSKLYDHFRELTKMIGNLTPSDHFRELTKMVNT